MPRPKRPTRVSRERYCELRFTGASTDIVPNGRGRNPNALPLAKSTGLLVVGWHGQGGAAPPAPQQNFGMPTPGLDTIDLPSALTVPRPMSFHWLESGSGVRD